MARLINADELQLWLVNMLSEFDDGNDPQEIKREMFQCVLAKTRKMQTIDSWVSVNDRMPEEHPSMFATLYGSEKWNNAMWRNESDRVLVTILFPDGTRTVDKGKLQDGKWKTGVSPVLPQEVTHWAVWPEPPKEVDTDGNSKR